MRVLIVNLFLAGFLAGMIVAAMVRGRPDAAAARAPLEAQVARLERERQAARRREVYLVLDADAQQIALACRGVALWKQPVTCDATVLQGARNGQKLTEPPVWHAAPAREDSARLLARASIAPTHSMQPVANANPPTAKPIATLVFEETRLRLVTPRPAPPARSSFERIGARFERRDPAPIASHAAREIEVEISRAAAHTLCGALVAGSVLLLQPLGSTVAAAKPPRISRTVCTR